MSANEPAEMPEGEMNAAAVDGARSALPFPIVGVGASAGGLEAITKLLEAIPRDSGLAFLIVQHLDREHHSQLPELLARTVALPVQEATESLHIEPNHVYVIPPNSAMRIVDDHLTLGPRPA